MTARVAAIRSRAAPSRTTEAPWRATATTLSIVSGPFPTVIATADAVWAELMSPLQRSPGLRGMGLFDLVSQIWDMGRAA